MPMIIKTEVVGLLTLREFRVPQTYYRYRLIQSKCAFASIMNMIAPTMTTPCYSWVNIIIILHCIRILTQKPSSTSHVTRDQTTPHGMYRIMELLTTPFQHIHRENYL